MSNKPDLMIKRVDNGYLVTDLHSGIYGDYSDSQKVFMSIQQVLDCVHKYFEPKTKIQSDMDDVKAFQKQLSEYKYKGDQK